jgi:hypothetical protein
VDSNVAAWSERLDNRGTVDANDRSKRSELRNGGEMAVAESGSAGRRAAASRGEAARRRIGELQQRRAELAAGMPSSPETVEKARLHARESVRRVRQAHRDASARHLDAGAAHRRAAASHEQAALVARDRASEAHQDAAAVHRAAAAVHDAAASVEEGHAAALDDDRPAQGWASINSNAPETPPSGP